jgi:hypothetical protein
VEIVTASSVSERES